MSSPGLAARYGTVLRGTGALAPLLASLLGRVALGTTGLALLLLTRSATGSYSSAGLVSASYATSFAVFSPLRARRADRAGPRGVLVACSLVHPVVLVALVALASHGAPTAVLAVLAVAAGSSVPPLSGVMRALWGVLVPEGELVTAYSLEAVVVELCFVTGPLLVAGLTALSGPSAPVLAGGALVLVGGLGLAAAPALRGVRPHEPGRARVDPLSSPRVRSLLLTVGWVGVGFGAVEVALPAFVESAGARPGASGVLLAIWSAGSVLGGLLYGAAHLQTPHERQLPWLVGAVAVGTVLPLAARAPVVMGVLLVLYGLTIAPFSTCNSVLLGRATPAGTATEAFAWSGSLIFGGAALGNAAAGALAQASGATAALLLCAGSGVLALGSTLVTRAPSTRRSPGHGGTAPGQQLTPS